MRTCARKSSHKEERRQRMRPFAPATFGKTIPAGDSKCHTTWSNTTPLKKKEQEQEA